MCKAARDLLLAERSRKPVLGGIHGGERGLEVEVVKSRGLVTGHEAISSNTPDHPSLRPLL